MGLKDRIAAVPVLGTALVIQERYTRDAADPLAASIGFFGFLSLFPLLALAVSVAGFVLDDPEDQVAVATAITEALPGFEATLEDDGDATAVDDLVQGVVDQRGTIGLVGLITLLLPGMKVVNGAMTATRVVLRGQVVKGVGGKVRQLLALIGLGTLALLAAGASSLAGTGIGQLPGFLALVVSIGLTFVLDLALFLGAYVLLSPTAPFTARELLPGAILGALGWMALKVVGASYIGNQVDGANALYGALGGVIGLLLLLYLAGRLYLYGAELSAVRKERRDGPLPVPFEVAAGGDEDAADGPDPAAGGGAAGTGASGADAGSTPGGADAGDPSRRRVAAGGGGRAGTADGPPPVPRAARQPRPHDPGPAVATPTVGGATRDRLAVADREQDARDSSSDLRRTVAFGLGVAALAAAWRWLGPDRE